MPRGILRMGQTRHGRTFCLLFLLVHVIAVSAQELEPRAYSRSPVGTTFISAVFGNSSGGITFDPSLPITNAHANVYLSALAVGQTFPVLGRQALVTVGLPYAWGRISGQVGEQSGTVRRSGLADSTIRFSMNLHGSPALWPREFAASSRRSLILGTSLTVDAPSGQYASSKLINIGTNRWALKPEVGFSYPVSNFDLDFYVAAWFFTDNARFFPGSLTKSQDFLPSAQAHISYTFRRSLWCAVDSTWYGNGATHLNDGPPTGRQNSSRVGVTLSLPLVKQQSLKFAYSSGVTERFGSNFRTLSISWQHVWFDRH
jgi:Putative MetA-pathway of phenol degradation